MLRATGRYADAWFPVAIFSPERYADGLQQVQAAADNANRDPHSIIAANAQFVVTGRSAGEVEEALDSVPVRAYSLLVPDSEWAKHGARHPMGEDFTGFQDILPQTTRRGNGALPRRRSAAVFAFGNVCSAERPTRFSISSPRTAIMVSGTRCWSTRAPSSPNSAAACQPPCPS